MSQIWDEATANHIIDRHIAAEGPALPILNDLQAEFGCISERAMRLLASRLNVTRAEIYGIVTFYHDYRLAPHGQHVLKLCRAEACQSMGAEGLSAALLSRLGLSWGDTTADGRLTVEPVYCLGLCATAPSALLDGEPHGRLDHTVLHALAGLAS
ncbi:MAG: NAD(P)H-dependent oxidoreductase subunit E [Acidocella sp.]|nr:NAD(P)H-dependent oxidoreductase subunit E [Acidocella sp.]